MRVGALLVRGGIDTRVAHDPKTRRTTHTLVPVYSEMLRQICRDYASLPDPRSLTMTEIRFFYDALRPELRRHTKPKSK